MSLFPSPGFRVSVCQTLLLEWREKSCCVPMVRSAIRGAPASSFTGRDCIFPHWCPVTSLDFSRHVRWDSQLAETKCSVSKEAEAYFWGNWLSRDTSLSIPAVLYVYWWPKYTGLAVYLCAAAKSEWESLFARTYCRNGMVFWEELASTICHVREKSVSPRPSHSYDRLFSHSALPVILHRST